MEQHFNIEPPLLNSANPWCTSLEQLQELYSCPHVGAVTSRTSLVRTGFSHDEKLHQFAFYNPSTHVSGPKNPVNSGPADQTGSLNTLGYSPLSLEKYLEFIQIISDALPNVPSSSDAPASKPFIVSVTGTVEEVVECYTLIHAKQGNVKMKLAMEVNLSCPNIPDKPPPAYDSAMLLSYLKALKEALSVLPGQGDLKQHIPIGIKTPPYTYHDQFKHMINALLASTTAVPNVPEIGCPVSFITATNTLGSSLLLAPHTEQFQHTLGSATGPGIGGLAGAPLHPLALGNVYTIRKLLSEHKELEDIQIIGVGGVDDVDGYQRMRSVGANAVGVGTALGRKGVRIFHEIGEALQQAQ